MTPRTSPGARGLLPSLLAGLALFGCGELPAIGANQCGNGVLEAGEACDGPQPEGQACANDCQAFVCGTPLTKTSSAGESSTLTTSCPAGRSCGLDGTCYAAKGVLGDPAGGLRGAADHFASVQLTAGRPRTLVAQTGDFLRRGKPRFVTFDANGATADDATLPTSIGALTSTDLENDGAEELYGAVPGGTVVFDAPGDGTISPRSYATFSALPGKTRIAPVRRPTETYDDGLLLSTESPPDGTLQVVGFSQNPTLAAPVLRFPGDAAAILRTASLPEKTAQDETGCSPLLFALAGQLDVLRADPCERTATGVQMFQSNEREGLPARNAQPLVRAPFPIVGGPFVLHVDPDPHPDVVVIVQLPGMDPEALLTGGYGLAIAFGGEDGFGTWPSGTSRVLGMASRIAIDTRVPLRLEHPLALAPFPGPISPAEDFPVDGRWTYAGTDTSPGILAAFERGAGIGRWATSKEADGSGAIVFSIGYTRQSPWTTVAIASINGDGYPDVVGGSQDENDLDILVSSGGPLFSVGSVSTNAKIAQLALADFDGDLVSDIAFSSNERDSSGTTNATLSVIYGRSLALPDPLVVVGRYPDAAIEQVVGSQFGFADSSVDFGSELAVVLSATNATKQTVSVLRGDGNRLPLAPLSLTAPMGVAAGTLAVATARSAENGGKSRFVMVGDGGEAGGLSLWEADDAGAVSFSAQLIACATSNRIRRADAVALDLNANGSDEIAVVADCGDNKPQLLVLAERTGAQRLLPALDARPVQHPTSPAVDAMGSLPGQVSYSPRQITLSAGDVDLDGVPDVLAQADFQAQDGGPNAPRSDTRTLLFLGNGTTLAASPIDLRFGDDPIVATAFVAFAAGAPKRLVAAGRNAVYVARAGIAAGSVELEPLPLPPTAFVGSPGFQVRALLGGDFTGDSVDDLVIGSAEGFQLLPGLATR